MALINPAENIPTKLSKGDEWAGWYSELKSRYGKQNANAIFTKAWGLRGSDSALTSDLDTLLKSNGVNLQRGSIASIEAGAYNIIDKVEGVFSFGKYFVIGGIALVAVPVFILLINLARKPERIGAIAGTAAKVMI